MKHIFIDCGTNLGQGLQRFNKKLNLFNNDKWKIYTFEPNKYINIDNILPKVKNLIKYKKAVWIYDGNIKFLSKGKNEKYKYMRGKENKFQGGGSQLSICKSNAEIPVWDEEEENIVECIDFSNFLKQFSGEDYYVVVKFDIEGAEEKLIDYLIQTGNIKIINKLFIETHGRFHFKRSEWNKKKDEISRIDNSLINKCKKYISYVEKWD